ACGRGREGGGGRRRGGGVGFVHGRFELGLGPADRRPVLAFTDRADRQGSRDRAEVDHDVGPVGASHRADFGAVGSEDLGPDCGGRLGGGGGGKSGYRKRRSSSQGTQLHGQISKQSQRFVNRKAAESGVAKGMAPTTPVAAEMRSTCREVSKASRGGENRFGTKRWIGAMNGSA